MKSKRLYLSRNSQTLAKNIVLIDGFSGSGKTLVAPAISHLKYSEQWLLNEVYDNISILNYFGDISKKSANTLLNVESDKNIYNLMIGRNVNFRCADISSPQHNNLYQKYYSRTKKIAGDMVSDEIDKINPILPLHVHYIFGYTDLLLKCFEDKLKLYIVVLRNPFFLIKTWIEGNWVNRRCNTNRDTGLCFDYFGKEIPWYTKEYAKEYIEANDYEKSVLTVYNLYIRIFSMYNGLPELEREKMMFIFYEDFVANPDKDIDKICKTLDTERDDNFKVVMQNLSIPRSLEKYNFISINEFLEEYKQFFSEDILFKLRELDRGFLDFHKQVG
jgi:hypothetical protein